MPEALFEVFDITEEKDGCFCICGICIGVYMYTVNGGTWKSEVFKYGVLVSGAFV